MAGGGVNRGRADAAMIWGREAPDHADKFKARALPSAKYRDPEQIETVGIGSTSPSESGIAGQSSGTASVEDAKAKTTTRRRLAPRHRHAVKSFFSRPSPKSEQK